MPGESLVLRTALRSSRPVADNSPWTDELLHRTTLGPSTGIARRPRTASRRPSSLLDCGIGTGEAFPRATFKRSTGTKRPQRKALRKRRSTWHLPTPAAGRPAGPRGGGQLVSERVPSTRRGWGALHWRSSSRPDGPTDPRCQTRNDQVLAGYSAQVPRLSPVRGSSFQTDTLPRLEHSRSVLVCARTRQGLSQVGALFHCSVDGPP